MGVSSSGCRRFRRPALALIALAIAVTGCASPSGPAPVDERTGIGAGPPERVVRAGDTLYSIAWEARLDFNEVARWNRIDPPYLIRPGQRIQLRPPTVGAGAPPAQPAPQPAAAAPAPPPQPAMPAPTPAEQAWLWPADGNVIQRYSAGSSPGVVIGGSAGAPIRAARGGRVVYAGGGLRGYGELIIIKHDEVYLSAYAHNRKLLVAEGETVQRGQQIAEMGDSGSTRVALHFEVRRQGTPIDPLGLLPQR